MSFFSRFKKSKPVNEEAGLGENDDLTNRLAEKRKNATVTEAGPSAPSSIENTVAKAKAMRTVNVGSEGKLLDNDSGYRDSK